jgi:hypothetical protein
MTKKEFLKQDFRVEGVSVSPEDAMRMWKKIHKTYDNFYEQIIKPTNNEFMNEMAMHIKKEWDNVKDITSTDAFALKNVELRRLYFKAIGVIEMFKEMEPTLVDTKTLVKNGYRWDENNVKVPYEINDKYELYKIDGCRLYPEESSSWRSDNATVYAVRCWCSTTGREYWIYVPRNVGEEGNALNAIAWTVRLNHTYPKSIIRQGDVILYELSSKSEVLEKRWGREQFHHLTGKEYTDLIIATT